MRKDVDETCLVGSNEEKVPREGQQSALALVRRGDPGSK